MKYEFKEDYIFDTEYYDKISFETCCDIMNDYHSRIKELEYEIELLRRRF